MFLRIDNVKLLFTGGPRVCIGQRFSMIEMKTALVKILSKYRIIATEDTKLDFQRGDTFLLSYPEMKVKLAERV